jgi:hypothetical protein
LNSFNRSHFPIYIHVYTEFFLLLLVGVWLCEVCLVDKRLLGLAF